MGWWVVYDDTTGVLLSEGSRDPGRLESGLSKRDIESRPDTSANRWDQADRRYEPYTPDVSADRAELLRLRRDGVADADIAQALTLLLRALPARTFE